MVSLRRRDTGRRSAYYLQRAAVAATLLSLVVAACGGSGSSTQSGTSSKGPSHITIAQDIWTLSSAPLYVAMADGYFKKHNLDVSLQTMQSGSVTTQAMASGSVPIAASGSFEMAAAVAKGLPFQAFASLANVAMELCVSKQVASAEHLTSSSTAATVLTALKGRTLGVTGANSSPDLVLRYLLTNKAHLKPDTDVKITALGSVGAEVSAISRGQIDGFLQSPPGCEQAVQAGNALNLIPATRNGLSSAPLSVFYAKKDWLSGHKGVVSAVSAALMEAVGAIRNRPDVALPVLQKYFPSLPRSVLEGSFRNSVVPLIPSDGKATSSGWRAVNDIIKPAGGPGLPSDQGTYWTTEYLPHSS